MRVPFLSVENLSLAFRTRAGSMRALDRVRLHVHQGEAVGVVGESSDHAGTCLHAVVENRLWIAYILSILSHWK